MIINNFFKPKEAIRLLVKNIKNDLNNDLDID